VADFQNAYSYDGFGRESQVSQSGVEDGNAIAEKLVTFGYDADNQFTAIDRYSDLSGSTLVAKSAYGYDSVGRLTSLDQGNSTSSTAYAGDTLSYDADSRVSGATNSAQTSENVVYTYNSDGELIAATYASDTSLNESFSYDANGNPTNTGDSLVAHSNELASDGTYNYLYDADGNMTSQTNIATGAATVYTYNNRGMQTSAMDKDPSDRTTEVIDYTYDVFNNLIGRTTTAYSYVGDSDTPSTTTTTTARYVYDLSTGNMVLAFDGSGNLTDRFLWGPGTNQILADEVVTSTDAAGTVYWALANNQGSVTDVINSSGVVQNHTAYDPFGNVIPSLSTEAVDFLFGQYGEFADPATGQVFAKNRVYDPAINRWGGPDPTGLLFGPNPYQYCADSATNFVDPSGFREWPGDGPPPSGYVPSGQALQLQQMQQQLQQQQAQAAPSADGKSLAKPLFDFGLGAVNDGMDAAAKRCKGLEGTAKIVGKLGIINDVYNVARSDDPLDEGIKTGAGFFGGRIGSALLGALAGSEFGPVGTIVGATAGGFFGDQAGEAAASALLGSPANVFATQADVEQGMQQMGIAPSKAGGIQGMEQNMWGIAAPINEALYGTNFIDD
jgi:RHS repeat-associated protein